MSKEKAQRQIQQKMEQDRQYHGKKQLLFRVCIFIMMFLIVLFIGTILYLTLGDYFQSSRGELLTKENASEYLEQLASQNPGDNSYEITMSTTWIFQDSKTPSPNAYVENCLGNQNAVYFTVTLADNTDKILYSSKKIDIGEYDNHIKLQTSLNRGNYDAILTYFILDEQGNCISTIPVSIQIQIQN